MIRTYHENAPEPSVLLNQDAQLTSNTVFKMIIERCGCYVNLNGVVPKIAKQLNANKTHPKPS
jgi:hypothetical protein